YLVTVIGAMFDAGKNEQTQLAIDQLMAFSEAHHDDGGLVLAHTANAHRMAAVGKAGEALVLLDKLEPVALRSGDAEAIWIYHLVRGNLQNTLGQFELALSNTLKSMEVAITRPRQTQASLLRSQVQLGLIYMAMKNGEKALKTIDDAQTIATRLGATQIQGVLHLNRGNVESSLGRQDAALQAYQAALTIGDAAGLVSLQAAALNNMGDIHLIRKAYALAEPIERQALARYQEAGEAGGAALARANVGFALMGQGRIDEGVAEVKAGLKFMHDAGARTMEEILLEELSRMYEQAGLYREAVETVRAQQVLSKALLRADREQAVATLQAQFDAEQRERQIEGLAQDNRLKDAEIHNRRLQQMATVIGAAGTVVAGGFIFALYRRTRRSNRELHQAKRLADEALHDKNLFLATASHDLRQPVHAMSMMAEAIGLRNQDAALTPLLVDLKSSMTSMSQLFNALLDLSRLEAGSVPSRAVPADLNALLGEVLRMFREQASMAGLTLRLHLPRCGAVVVADPTLLRQALVNLTHNAIRYTPQGQVLLGVRRRGDHWQIEVWDTGMGIAPGEQPQVFSPYYRSEQASHLDRAGHGLGLAVVARCAKLMGATHGFQSRFGKGSRFWLRLAASPAHGEAGEVAVESATTSGPDAFHRLNGRCLVLDDDRQVLTAWQAMLESWGVDARLASTA
ncbi:MAG TPA: HAMP domain-containing sensor histidine kinase, partial [Hydrogenophaga sp.]|nr:HAMP domain-containing sensor histidine kinase [Hydrogenophaga sp.]